jgi:hypothetical protein
MRVNKYNQEGRMISSLFQELKETQNKIERKIEESNNRSNNITNIISFQKCEHKKHREKPRTLTNKINKKPNIFDMYKDIYNDDELDEYDELEEYFKNQQKMVKEKNKAKNRSNTVINYNTFDLNAIKAETFENRMQMFKRELKKIKIDWIKGACIIKIDRENILDSSINEWKNIDPFKELKIHFIGETANDAGGIIREWLTVLFKEILDDETKLFEKSDNDIISYKIHKDCIADYDILKRFEYIGKFIAKAILENLNINLCFNHLLYKILLEEPVVLQDIVFIDKQLYSSLKAIKESKEINEMELYFSVQNMIDGKVVEEELIPNGLNTKVTNENVDFFIQKKIDFIVYKTKVFVDEIKKGFNSVFFFNKIDHSTKLDKDIQFK